MLWEMQRSSWKFPYVAVTQWAKPSGTYFSFRTRGCWGSLKFALGNTVSDSKKEHWRILIVALLVEDNGKPFFTPSLFLQR